jgi:glycosyltransferase involved in cell wall biosynthesis
MPRLESAAPKRADIRGVRVVMDARPMQEPERSPLTADYLDHLLKAFAREPLPGESFVIISRTLRDDPADVLEDEGLPVVARRRVPPTTRVFRSAGMTLDSFLLRGAEIGAASSAASGVDDDAASDDPAGGAVFHTAGGAVPVASGLPIVATLLDLAPWELPGIYASSAAARFGHRLRARVLHDAARVIVCSRASAETARRRLHLPQERLAVVPLAVDESFRAAGKQPDAVAETRARLGIPARYLCFAGRYDARKDMRTLFEALKQVRDRYASGQDRGSRARRGSASGANASSEGQPTPAPTIVFALTVGAPDEADVVARQIASNGMNELVRLVVPQDAAERARILAGAEAFVYPALSEATALPVLEALSLGVPVICTRAGALPESVASAGIVVAPRDANRLAAAIEAIWDGGSLAEQLRKQAHRRAESMTRTWSDVARETRDVYAAAALDSA